MEAPYWRKCSSCKKPIGFKQAYQRCNISTCNQPRTSLVFCTVSCWSAHVPVLRHKDAWALEEISPSEPAEDGPQRSTTTPPGSAPARPAQTDEVLVVVSKLKNYIRERSEMNTSADVNEILSDKIRALCDAAIAHARSEGRKTVMARDF